MYDYEFYAEVDSLICKQLKRCARMMAATIMMLLLYLSTLPVRLIEWVKDWLFEEKRVDDEIDERVENLMKNGHI